MTEQNWQRQNHGGAHILRDNMEERNMVKTIHERTYTQLAPNTHTHIESIPKANQTLIKSTSQTRQKKGHRTHGRAIKLVDHNKNMVDNQHGRTKTW